MSREINEIGFTPEGEVYITFIDTKDIRMGGAVALRHTLRVAPTEDYAETIQRLVDAAQRLLSDALADHATSEPVSEAELVGESQQERGTPVADDEDEAARNWAAIEDSREGGHKYPVCQDCGQRHPEFQCPVNVEGPDASRA